MSKRILTKVLMPLMLASALIPNDDKHIPREESEPRPRGYTKPPKTEEKKRLHKEHQKKIKTRRKVKKGIYEHKIVYKKNRK